MSKRTTFTTISPLPQDITREFVMDFLHNYEELIDLNPLVKDRHRIEPPAHATSDELHCTWYSLTDRISYLPGGLMNGDVTYTCAFHDLPNGIQTHCYAPAGLSKCLNMYACLKGRLTLSTDIREKWTLNGSLPGEPIEPVELGTGAPVTGLYIREDVDMRCNVIMTNFVKKTLKKSHAALIERLKTNARLVSATEANARLERGLSVSQTSSSAFFTPPPSVQSSGPEIMGKSSESTCTLPKYIPSLSTTPSSGFPTRQVQDTLTSAPGAGYTLSYHPNRDPHQYHPLPSPHQTQQHSFHPGYGRDTQQQQSNLMARQEQVSDQGLVPAPLRLRQPSAGSASFTTSTCSIAHGRSTFAAVKAQSSGQYRASHPDYPHMNPYADDRDRQARRQDSPGELRGLGADHPTVGKLDDRMQGPFIAELEA